MNTKICGKCAHFCRGSGLTRSYCSRTKKFGGHFIDQACDQYQSNRVGHVALRLSLCEKCVPIEHITLQELFNRRDVHAWLQELLRPVIDPFSFEDLIVSLNDEFVDFLEFKNPYLKDGDIICVGGVRKTGKEN